MNKTYCASDCGNTKCKRHVMNAPKNLMCSWAYFYEETKCKDFIARISLSDLLKSIQ